MRRRAAFAFGTPVVLLALAQGCMSADPPNGGDGGGPDRAGPGAEGRSDTLGASNTGSGGGASGGSASIERSACGLPLFGETGQPEPSGPRGGIEVIDWAGALFAVSFTFDDSNSSQVSAYGDLRALRVPMTFYLQTGKDESTDPVWDQALADGHELANHTESHLKTGEGADIDAATMFIEETFGVTPRTMAAPYGSTTYVPLAEERFFINRGTPSGSVRPMAEDNPFNLPCYVPATGASAAAMNEVIDAASGNGAWQIELIHGFTGGTDAAYQPVGLSEFLAHVEYTKAKKGVWIDTVAAIGAYFLGQKLVVQAPSTSDGQQTTSRWTLPDHFPPGQCVRVRTHGGTLLQAGRRVPWNEHGYYEVELDIGELTLAP